MCVDKPKEKYDDDWKEVLDELYSVVLDRKCNTMDVSIVSHDPARLVVFSSKDRPDVYIPTEKTGSFFVMLPGDTYSLAISATNVDSRWELFLLPSPCFRQG